MSTKNINAEKIQGNLDVSGLSATTFNVNEQYDLPTNSVSNGDFFMYSGGSSSWNSIEALSITGTTGGTIPFVNSIGTDFEYKGGFNYDLNKLNITSSSNVGTSIHKEGGLSISGNSGVITFSGYNSSLSAATISSDNNLLLYASGTTPSVYGQDKQLYLSSSNPYVGINTITPQASLNIKGVSNTTGYAFLVNKVNNTKFQLVVYNNRDIINSGYTHSTVGVNFNWYTSNQTYLAGLPTIGGENNHFLVRVENPADRYKGTNNFNTFWHDYRQGNQFWYTGVTASGDTILYPSAPDVEFLYNPTDTSSYRNVFGYDTASKLDLESYDNLLVSYDGKFMSSSTYRRRMNRCLVVGVLHEIGATTQAPNIDNSFNVTNFITYGTTNYVNRSSGNYYTSGVSDLSGKTSIKNFIVGGSYNTVNSVRDGVSLVGGSVAQSSLYAGENVYSIGCTNTFTRQRKQQPPYQNDAKASLDVKNIWSFGGGFNGQPQNNKPVFDNTINIGTVSHNLLQGSYYSNVGTKNVYDTPWPYQTKGIWIGTKDSWSPDPIAGFWLDPQIEDKGNVNFGFGNYYPFYTRDDYTKQELNGGLNRPGSGAGIFYISKPYFVDSGGSNTSVPRSYYNNAVGLGNNEQYYGINTTVAPHPTQNSSLLIHSGEGVIHLIGQGMYVNPNKEVLNNLLSDYSASTYQLSGSSAMLDVTGSGATSGTTSVRIKNSGDTVGLEVLDDGQVSFNGIPTGSGGLTAGYLYKDGSSGQLKIVSGASVAGNYCPPVSPQHLEVMLLSQTQTFSNAGTTVITDGGLVQQINDLSGKNNNATQTTSGDRFNWNVSASTLNNYSYLSNSDTSRFMNLTNGMSLSASTVDDTGFCINVVMRINTSDTFRLFESSTTNDFLGEFSYDVPNSFCDWTHSGSTSSLTTSGGVTYNLGDWAVFSFFNIDGGDYLYTYINGNNNQGSYISTNIYRNLDRILVGGDIDVAEFTLYNKPADPSLSDFVDIYTEMTRLMTKYNIS
jgi:hypothetical protein